MISEVERILDNRFYYLFFLLLLEAEPAIEPRYTALQSTALLYFSISYEICHPECHSVIGIILIFILELMKLTIWIKTEI